jgi:predicted DNA-binding protein
LIEGNIEDLEDRYLAEKVIAESGLALPASKSAKSLAWRIEYSSAALRQPA